MPKIKPNKALLKRIRFTKSGRVKFRRSFGRHLRSHKSGKLMRSYRRPAFVKGCDMKRVRMMLFTGAAAGIKASRKEPAAAAE
jgi:large subunit ribosomal protein L35